VARADSPLRVAFFGGPGVYDESALLSFLLAYPAVITRTTNTSPVTEEGLAAFDVVILDQLTRDFEGSEAAALASWVHAGGAVMSLTGYLNADSDWSRPNSLLARMPARYVPGLIAAPPSLAFLTTFSPHPLTADLHSVPFWGAYHVALSGECDGDTRVVASLEGAPVAIACEHGAGRLYVWGDEWVEYSSQWTRRSDAPRFWQNAICWLSRRGGALKAVE